MFSRGFVIFILLIAFIIDAKNMPLLPAWIGERLNQTIPVKLLVATNNWNAELTLSFLYLSFSVCGQVCCCIVVDVGWLEADRDDVQWS
jgi:hypothetical protein